MSDEGGESPAPRFISAERIKRGILLFAALTVGSLLTLFLYTSTGETYVALRHLDPRYLLASFVLWPVIVALGGWRNHIVVRHMHPHVNAAIALRANLANEAMAALTPSQTGGGIAQVYVFAKAGVPASIAVAATVITFFSTLGVLLLNATFGLLVAYDLYEHSVLRTYIQLAYVLFVIALVALLLALWQFRWVEILWKTLSRLVQRWVPRWAGKLDALHDKIAKSLQRFRRYTTAFIREAPWLLMCNFLVTLLLYGMKYVLAYFIVLGLGVDASFVQVAAIQAILLFVVYFAPTPGGSGLAEVGAALFMAPVLPSYLLPVFALLFRFFVVYLSAILGGTMFLRELAGSGDAR